MSKAVDKLLDLFTLSRGEVFTSGGDLVVSVVQEGLIRTQI